MTVKIERVPPITTITMNRPEVRNAIDRPTANKLVEAFRAFDEDKDASVAVLCGAGGHFCAGADLKAISRGTPNRLAPHGDGPMGPSRMLLSKPVIAAVSGFAVAGGLELALWCDLRIVESDAIMGVFCRKWGVPLIDGGSIRLPQIVGLGRALDLIMTGREVKADEALSMGLATQVVAPGEARQVAEELGRTLAKLPQTCLRSDRRSVYSGLGLSVSEGMQREFHLAQDALGSAELAQGASRFQRRSEHDER